MNEFKKIEGQPWSAWKNIIDGRKTAGSTPECKKDHSPISTESTSCMKMSRSDMALFGICPKTETFELVVCNFCENKYKLPAFAEHIKLRHSNITEVCSKSESEVDTAMKKGKIRKSRMFKPNEKENDIFKTQININIKLDFMEVASDKQSLPIESDNVSKVKPTTPKENKIPFIPDSEPESSPKEETVSLEKENKCAVKSERKEITCNGTHDPNTIRPQYRIEVSTRPQTPGVKLWQAPGFRRSGGLLYAGRNIPRLKNRSKRTSFSQTLLRRDETKSLLKSCNFTERKEVIELIGTSVNNENEIKKIQLEIDYGSENNQSLPNKVKALSSTPSNLLKNHISNNRVLINQQRSNNKTVICKRPSNNINGAVSTKKSKSEDILNIVGSVFGKTEQGLPVMQLEVPTSLFDKKLITTSAHHISSTIAGVEVIDGSVLQGGPLRIGTPRIHYFTSSGPLPVVSPATNIQQLKPMRVQRKFQIVAPQINIAPASNVYFLQKTTTNSSNMNGMEDR